MKYGVSLLRSLVVLSMWLILSFPSFSQASWEKITIPENHESLDTIWGTSESNVYVIGFTGHIFHKGDGDFSEITDSVFGDRSINITRAEGNTPDEYPVTRLPYGLGGTGADNVYITGMTVKTDYLDSSNNVPWATTVYEATPFVMRYDGENWVDIPLTGLTEKYIPQVIVGICGTGPEVMMFSGWKVIRDTSTGEIVDTNTGVILGCNALTSAWTGEVGDGDLIGGAFSVRLPEINEITLAGDSDVFAVGLSGLILHKTLPGGVWSVMSTESSSLNFFRVWGDTADNVFAVGVNNSNYKAVIYRYQNSAWISMGIPKLKQGQIPALWGIWGQSSDLIHAVGNSGATLYYDGNSGNQWYSMISDTSTSLNCVWGADFNHAYACGEDGNVYHYTEGIKTDGVGAYPMISVAPADVEFSDISPGEVIQWDWHFNDTVSGPVAPRADLDSVILVTGPYDTALNGCRIKVKDGGDGLIPYLVMNEAISAQVDLAGKLLVTSVPGQDANGSNITVQEIRTDSTPTIYHYKTEMIVKVVAGVTTQSQVADLLESLDIIASAEPDSPDEPWFPASGSPVSEATLTGGVNATLNVIIDSGATTHREIAELLETHEWVQSAVADSPDAVWIRGRERVSNVAAFSGGLEDSNHYVTTDTQSDDYYMAYHTYTEPGTYEADLSITRPVLPPMGDIVVREEERPDVLTYDQDMFIAAVPGTSLNGFCVSIEDGGPGATPGIQWTDRSLTAIIESGVTLQSEVAALLITHHLILAALPSYPDKPWYVANPSEPDSVLLYGGANAMVEQSSVTIQVLDKNPLDFTITPDSGVGDLYATFMVTPSDAIRDKIYKCTWYFNYKNNDAYGTVTDGTIRVTTTPDEPIVHHYDEIGAYNVMLSVILDDNSPFFVFKEDAVLVRSPDEGKSSLDGGSGLRDVSGCFIGVLKD